MATTHQYNNMLWLCLLLSVFALHGSAYQLNNENHRDVRQLNFGSLLNPTNNQANRRGPPCEGPRNQIGKCLPIEQCVLKELDEDYIKNKGYFCTIRIQGPVGVCCPDAIAKPVTYREGMFGNKNTASGKLGEIEDVNTTPNDVE